jgi:hypothetical protein
MPMDKDVKPPQECMEEPRSGPAAAKGDCRSRRNITIQLLNTLVFGPVKKKRSSVFIDLPVTIVANSSCVETCMPCEVENLASFCVFWLQARDQARTELCRILNLETCRA